MPCNSFKCCKDICTVISKYECANNHYLGILGKDINHSLSPNQDYQVYYNLHSIFKR